MKLKIIKPKIDKHTGTTIVEVSLRTEIEQLKKEIQ